MSKRRNPAKYNKRIEVWGKEKVVNELLETTYQDKLIKTIWACIIPQTGKLQKQQADTILTNVTHKILCRYSAGDDIKNDNWIIYKNNRFDIKFILNPYYQNKELEIFTEQKEV